MVLNLKDRAKRIVVKYRIKSIFVKTNRMPNY